MEQDGETSGYRTRSSRAASCGRFTVGFLREFSTLISTVATPICNPNREQGCPRARVRSILTGERSNLRAVWICISLIDRNNEQFLRYFVAISISSFENSVQILSLCFERIILLLFLFCSVLFSVSYMIWILILCQVCGWQRFSFIL